MSKDRKWQTKVAKEQAAQARETRTEEVVALQEEGTSVQFQWPHAFCSEVDLPPLLQESHKVKRPHRHDRAASHTDPARESMRLSDDDVFNIIGEVRGGRDAIEKFKDLYTHLTLKYPGQMRPIRTYMEAAAILHESGDINVIGMTPESIMDNVLAELASLRGTKPNGRTPAGGGGRSRK